MSLDSQIGKQFEDAVVSKEELRLFFQDRVLIGNLKSIWDGILDTLPGNLKTEAQSKKLILEEMIEMRGRFDKTYQFKIVDASPELSEKLELADNFVIFYEE